MNQGAEITIGLPVYNRDHSIKKVIESILDQSFENFDLLISDNASTDNTEKICRDFAKKDKRIRYFRQEENIGMNPNFKFVLDNALPKAKYFMWAASDDLRSLSFLERNISFLRNNENYIGSMSPSYHESKSNNNKRDVFSIEGSQYERINNFFKFAWRSHGIFYSVIKKEIIQQTSCYLEDYIAADWVVDFFLINYGQIARIESEVLIFGGSGASMQKSPWHLYTPKKIELLVPLFRFNKVVFPILFSIKTRAERLISIINLCKLNINVIYVFYRQSISLKIKELRYIDRIRE